MAEGQGKKGRGGNRIISGIVRGMTGGPRPFAPPRPPPSAGVRPGLSLQMGGPSGYLALRQTLVMTPTLGFKSDEEIAEAVERALILDPDKVG